MSVSEHTMSGHEPRQKPRRSSSARRRNWTPLNTVSMILGFVLFWPLGLGLLFWILSGRDVRDLPMAVREGWARVSDGWQRSDGHRGNSGNVVFNDYQRTQYDRIREIKDEIAQRAERFKGFRADARRRADQEEFNRFMASTPDQTQV